MATVKNRISKNPPEISRAISGDIRNHDNLALKENDMNATELPFSGGTDINATTSNYYLSYKANGWYVAGNGLLCPVINVEKGHEFIRELMELDRLKRMGQQNPGRI